jgi:ribosomal-protein-alanine N-acetyltransferase
LRIRTARLDLIAATLEHVQTELTAPDRLGNLLGAVVPEGWPAGEYDAAAMKFFRDRLEEGGPEVVGWYGWYAVRREEAGSPATLVGSGGYLGLPSPEGEVEIGYSLLPAGRGHGYATEITQALVARAFADPRVRRVIAHTQQDNQASIRVLERCGFSRSGMGEEPGSLRFTLTQSDSATV